MSRTESPNSDRTQVVSVLIVTYQTPPEMLRECLQSVLDSNYRPLELVIVDNSPGQLVSDALEAWMSEQATHLPTVLFLAQARNLGYAGATNRGIAASHGSLLLMLNPDAVLQPDTLALLVAASERHPDAVGFAPKVLLRGFDWTLDSIGLDLYLRGQAGQRGLGEPDLGQYDVEERITGLCFAAALIRRSAFRAEEVGPLDDHYFMFYEDVDWSMRASMQGRAFWTVPEARVRHIHSASTRAMRGSFKTRLIQRNLIWTAAKNLERRRVARSVTGHLVRTILSGVRGRHFWTALRTVLEGAMGVPWLVRARRDAQRRRVLPDRRVLAESRKVSSFDTHKYQPIPSPEVLVTAISRLYATAPNPVLGRLALQLTLAAETSMMLNAPQLAEMVRRSGLEITPALEWTLRSLEIGSVT